MRKIAFTAVALALSAAPLSGAALAQSKNVLNQQGGLVNVSVGNIDLLRNFLNSNEIEILENASFPITVQAPINVAAQVCGVAVNVLAQGGPSTNNCTATQGSEALADLVLRQVNQ